MKRYKYRLIPFMLLVSISSPATADPPDELREFNLQQQEQEVPQSKRAKKVLKTLASLGINDPNVVALVGQVDSRVKGRYLELDQRRIGDNTLTLHYEMRGVGLKNMELKFQPNESNFALTGRKEAAMLRYQLKF